GVQPDHQGAHLPAATRALTSNNGVRGPIRYTDALAWLQSKGPALMRLPALLLFTAVAALAVCGTPVPSVSRPADKADDRDKLPAARADAVKEVEDARKELISVNQDIWAYAELGLEEYKSAARLVKVLKKAGFTVEEGISGMPTAFIASWGKGGPV